MVFFFKQKTAYEIGVGLVGSEMCIRGWSLGMNLVGVCTVLGDFRTVNKQSCPLLHYIVVVRRARNCTPYGAGKQGGGIWETPNAVPARSGHRIRP